MSVAFSIKAQDIVVEEVEADTIVGDRIIYDGAIDEPSLADLAIDSIMNLSSLDSLGEQYLHFVLDFANLYLALNDYPLGYRENKKTK